MHYGIKQIAKRQGYYPARDDALIQTLQPGGELPKSFVELLDRVRKSGERLSLEELMIVADYYNRKYHDRLEYLKSRRSVSEALPDMPLIDIIIFSIHKKYAALRTPL